MLAMARAPKMFPNCTFRGLVTFINHTAQVLLESHIGRSGRWSNILQGKAFAGSFIFGTSDTVDHKGISTSHMGCDRVCDATWSALMNSSLCWSRTYTTVNPFSTVLEPWSQFPCFMDFFSGQFGSNQNVSEVFRSTKWNYRRDRKHFFQIRFLDQYLIMFLKNGRNAGKTGMIFQWKDYWVSCVFISFRQCSRPI